jgi:two-component system chemotaxis response regulator CheY
MKPPRVLVVDDDYVSLKIAEHNLRHAGLDVVTAEDGLDGWRLLLEQQFSFLVLDYVMPRMSGGQLISLLRQDPKHAGTPVALVTAKALEFELPEVWKALGVVAIFPKPFSPAQLTKTILQHVTIPSTTLEPGRPATWRLPSLCG